MLTRNIADGSGPPNSLPLTLIERVIVKTSGGDDTFSAAQSITEIQLAVDGGDGNDSIEGAGGDDFIAGSAGNDIVAGRQGNDTMFGGPGDDQILRRATDTGIDVAIGDDGLDRLVFLGKDTADDQVTITPGAERVLVTDTVNEMELAAIEEIQVLTFGGADTDHHDRRSRRRRHRENASRGR